MQEFSAISVSSYEAGALADQLSEQSRAGWSVVAIVPTGSTVTAYLSRRSDEHSADADDGGTPHVDVTPTSAASTVGAGDDVSDAGERGEMPTDPVGEAPGWAAGNRDTTGTAGTTDTSSGVGTSSGIGTLGGTDADDHFSVADEPASEPATTDVDATAAGATAGSTDAGAAPAGWYADPSSRFELRYWDGGQWTEHVSRAGQQYTDPPVA